MTWESTINRSSLYQIRPSLTTGVRKWDVLRREDEKLSKKTTLGEAIEGNMSSSTWRPTSTAADIDIHVYDSYPGGAHPGDYNH